MDVDTELALTIGLYLRALSAATKETRFHCTKVLPVDPFGKHTGTRAQKAWSVFDLGQKVAFLYPGIIVYEPSGWLTVVPTVA